MDEPDERSDSFSTSLLFASGAGLDIRHAKDLMADQFSRKTIQFLKEAGRETSARWLDQKAEVHEHYLVEPLQTLASTLLDQLADLPEARGYKFPRRGFGRLRRPTHKVGRGEPAYRNWVHLRAARPQVSRFDEMPGLYFFLSDETVFAGGGLYEPSSRQIKKLRAWLAEAPSDLDKLVKSAAFKKQFPRGLETEKRVKTFPRSYPPDHPQIEQLRLQAYYVKRDYSKQDLFSKDFAKTVVETWRQVLRLNAILSEALNRDDWQSLHTEEAETDAADYDAPNTELWDDRL